MFQFPSSFHTSRSQAFRRPQISRRGQASGFVLLALAAAGLAGCSGSFAPQADSPLATPLGHITGSVFGGQQPIQQAKIFLFSPGKTTGAASISLLTSSGSNTHLDNSGSTTNGLYYVLTDTTGSFNITGDYTCTGGQPVYMYSSGGVVTTGVTNSAAGEMTALGMCPSTGTFAGSISYIYENEISTVAAAYAMAGFATDPVHVSYSGSTLGLLGITNAFNTAANLYNFQSSSGALSLTPNGNGTVPRAEIITLANAVGACINSKVGSTDTPCTTLLGIKSGGTTGTAPTDTAGAMINLAHNPGNQTAAIYGLPTTSPPFSGGLTAQPNDFSIQIAYTGGGITADSYQYLEPHSLAVDASGNVWNANTSKNTLSALSPLGNPLANSPFSGGGLKRPVSVAIDTSGNIWTANYNGNSLSEFTNSGVAVTTSSGYKTGLGLSSPTDAQIDGGGNLWISNVATSTLVEVSSGGSLLATNGNNQLDGPQSLAIEPSNNTGYIWVANGAGGVTSVFDPADNSVGAYGGIALFGFNFNFLGDLNGSAIDNAGRVWLTSYESSQIYRFPKGGGTLPGIFNNLGSGINAVAIDGAGYVWVTDVDGGTIYELNAGATTVSPTNGFLPPAAATPDGIAIDPSGNVWYNTLSDNTLREIVGVATPVLTPIASGVKYGALGVRP